MKIKGQFTDATALIEEAKKLRGCYGESQYSKDLHKQLVELADGWQKIDKSTYEYWKDIDSEYTEWRLILR